MQTFGDGLAAEHVAPLLLTRGWWAGAQRFGGVLWSSDIFSTFDELKAQVPEGISASMSAIPWWTTGKLLDSPPCMRPLCLLDVRCVCVCVCVRARARVQTSAVLGAPRRRTPTTAPT